MAVRAKARYEITATDRTQQAFGSVRSNLIALTARFKVLAGVAGIGLVVKSLANMTRSTLEANNKLADLAVRLSTDTKTLSELKFAAESTSVRFESLITSMQRLTRRASEAAGGNEQLQDSFRELGLDAEKFTKLPLRDRVRELADALQSVEDGGDRLRLAFKLLDSEGVALLQTFADGGAGLDEFARQAAAAGVVMTEKMEKAAKESDKAFNLLRAEIDGTKQDLTSVLGPALDFAANRFKNFIRFERNMVRGLANIPGALMRAVGDLVTGGQFSQVREELGKVSDSADKTKDKFQELADSMDLSQRRLAGTISNRTPLGIETDKASQLLSMMQQNLAVQDQLTRRTEGRVIDTRFEAANPIGRPVQAPAGENEGLRQLVRTLQNDIQKRKTDQLLTEIKGVLERQGDSVAVVG